MNIRGQIKKNIEDAQYNRKVAEKGHQNNYHTLYVMPDGDVYWSEEVDSNSQDYIRYSNPIKYVAALATTGTGSVKCDCDWCREDEEPEFEYDELYYIESRLIEALDNIDIGYFDDEE